MAKASRQTRSRAPKQERSDVLAREMRKREREVISEYLEKHRGHVGETANALGVEFSTMRNVKKGTNPVSVNMAFKVSRLAEIPFDDVVAGKYPVKCSDVSWLRQLRG